MFWHVLTCFDMFWHVLTFRSRLRGTIFWGVSGNIYIYIYIYNVNPGLINHGLLVRGYSSNSHHPILFYGTLPIKQPFGVYSSRVDIICNSCGLTVGPYGHMASKDGVRRNSMFHNWGWNMSELALWGNKKGIGIMAPRKNWSQTLGNRLRLWEFQPHLWREWHISVSRNFTATSQIRRIESTCEPHCLIECTRWGQAS